MLVGKDVTIYVVSYRKRNDASDLYVHIRAIIAYKLILHYRTYALFTSYVYLKKFYAIEIIYNPLIIISRLFWRIHNHNRHILAMPYQECHILRYIKNDRKIRIEIKDYQKITRFIRIKD